MAARLLYFSKTRPICYASWAKFTDHLQTDKLCYGKALTVLSSAFHVAPSTGSLGHDRFLGFSRLIGLMVRFRDGEGDVVISSTVIMYILI